jgi:hypothetical protein
MLKRAAVICCCVSAMILFVGAMAQASPIVLFSTDDLGGGLFQYNLTIDNRVGTEPISGLSILHANTVFGLDPFSVLGVPAGWDFFPPLPPFVDDLDSFSTAPEFDAPVGDLLAGFFFQSTTAPGAIGNRFDLVLVSSSTEQTPVEAQPIPEPSTLLMTAIGTLVFLARHRRRSTSVT